MKNMVARSFYHNTLQESNIYVIFKTRAGVRYRLRFEFINDDKARAESVLSFGEYLHGKICNSTTIKFSTTIKKYDIE